jgi:hypothetical protein
MTFFFHGDVTGIRSWSAAPCYLFWAELMHRDWEKFMGEMKAREAATGTRRSLKMRSRKGVTHASNRTSDPKSFPFGSEML